MTQATHPTPGVPPLNPQESKKFQDLESHDPEGHGPNVAFTPTNLGRIILWIIAGALVCTVVIWTTLGIDSAFGVLTIIIAYLAIIAVPVGTVVWLRAKSRRNMQNEARGIYPASSPQTRNNAGRKLRKIDSQLADIDAQQRQDDDGGPPSGGVPQQDELLSEASTLREELSDTPHSDPPKH